MAIVAPTSLGSTHTGSTSGSTVAMTVTANVAIGDVIVVAVGSNTDNRALSSVTDSAGNTYTIRAQNQATGANVYVATAKATAALTAGVSTITATFASTLTSTRQIAAVKTSGVSQAPVDTEVNSGSSTAWNAGAVTNATADALIVGVGRRAANTSNAPDADYPEAVDISGGTATTAIVSRIVATPSTWTPSGTWASNGAWRAISLVLPGAVASSPPTGDATADADAPTSTVSGSPVTSNPPTGDATAEGDNPQRTDFPRGSILEDAETAEDPLSRGGTWRTDSPDLGSAARIRAAATRLQRSLSGTNASVRSATAIDAGLSIPGPSLPPVDLSATVAVQPGSAGAFVEVGLALTGDLGSSWSGYAVGVQQSGRCYVNRIVGGVATSLRDEAPATGAVVGADRFGFRLRHTSDGLLIQPYTRDAAIGLWLPHGSPILDPAPLTGNARVFVRIAGNNAANNTSAAIDDLRLGTLARSFPTEGDATAGGDAPVTTIPGAGQVSEPPTGDAVADADAPRYSGYVRVSRPPTGEALAEGGDEDGSASASAEADAPASSIDPPIVVQLGSLRAELLLGPMRQRPITVDIGSLRVDIIQGAAAVAQRLHLGGLRATIRPGGITVDPGVLHVPLGSLRAEARTGAAIVAQRMAIGSLTAGGRIGAVTLRLFARPVHVETGYRARVTTTAAGRERTSTTTRLTRN